MLTLYGIPNCDTMKKARQWLDQTGLDYRFHDYRKDGVDSALLERAIEQFGWEQVVNRRGTTWRQLPASTRESMDRHSALTVMQAQPGIIKRPLLDLTHTLLLGFSADSWQQALTAS